MPTLMFSDRTVRGCPALADAARAAGWRTAEMFAPKAKDAAPPFVYYGTTDLALDAARRFDLALIEPPLDMLARLPQEFLRRSVEFATFGDLDRLMGPTFVKPANPLNKSFDVGVYSNVSDIRRSRLVHKTNPVLLSEPVEWSSEYRCFILEGRLVAWSSYMTHGRLAWDPFLPDRGHETLPAPIEPLCLRLTQQVPLPPAFVVDIGLIDDRGWAIVEFNPAWCAGILGADPRCVLPVLERSCRDRRTVTAEDAQWLTDRRAKLLGQEE